MFVITIFSLVVLWLQARFFFLVEFEETVYKVTIFQNIYVNYCIISTSQNWSLMEMYMLSFSFSQKSFFLALLQLFCILTNLCVKTAIAVVLRYKIERYKNQQNLSHTHTARATTTTIRLQDTTNKLFDVVL